MNSKFKKVACLFPLIKKQYDDKNMLYRDKENFKKENERLYREYNILKKQVNEEKVKMDRTASDEEGSFSLVSKVVTLAGKYLEGVSAAETGQKEEHIRTCQQYTTYLKECCNSCLYEGFLSETTFDLLRNEFSISGNCDFCGEETAFTLEFSGTDPESTTLNFRESLVCQKCGVNNRIRFILTRLRREYRPGNKVYLCEQVTSAYEMTKKFIPDVIGSEFIAPNRPSGLVINGIRHEDAANLSFRDDFLDFYVTQDVLEHVPDCDKCFSEAYRVLKPGGKFMGTFPVCWNNEKNYKAC